MDVGRLVVAYILVVLDRTMCAELVSVFQPSGGIWVQWPFALAVCLRLAGNVAVTVGLLLWPRAGSPLMALLLISAVGAYSMNHYGARLNEEVIQIISETRRAEAAALLSIGAMGWFALYGIVPALLVLWLPRCGLRPGGANSSTASCC